MTVSKEQLLASRLPEDDLGIPGLGTVRVRALSRAEVRDKLSKAGRSDTAAWEALWLSMSLVDPPLTPEEAAQWRESATAFELELVTAKLGELSALTKQAAKDMYKEFESNPDAEFRDGAGGEAVDDGGTAAD